MIRWFALALLYCGLLVAHPTQAAVTFNAETTTASLAGQMQMLDDRQIAFNRMMIAVLLGGLLVTSITALALWHAIRQRHQAEQHLRQSVQQLDMFFAQSLTGFFFMMLDEPVAWHEATEEEKATLLEYMLTHHRLTKVNQAFLDHYGAQQEDMIGRTPHDFFAEDLDHGRHVLRHINEYGHLHEETREQRLDGTPIMINGDYTCLYDTQGRIIGHFGVQVDITERKHTERALKEAQRQLESALEAERRMRAEQARFIDTISHEYRTPLSILRTHLDVMQTKALADETRLRTMHNALRRLQDIFNHALATHRLGHPPAPEIKTLDLSVLLDAVLQEITQSFPGIVVHCSAWPPRCHFRGDAGLVKTALRNVLDNARKYRRPPDSPIEVCLTATPERITLAVRNAVDPERSLQRAELFERYVRGSTSAGESGVGLGLCLVQRILHDHQGEAIIPATAADRFEIRLILPRLPA